MKSQQVKTRSYKVDLNVEVVLYLLKHYSIPIAMSQSEAGSMYFVAKIEHGSEAYCGAMLVKLASFATQKSIESPALQSPGHSGEF